MKISFHTDAFNTSFTNFQHCVDWAEKNDVHWIECGLIDGVSWIQGLGYQPHVALYEDPLMLKNKMARQGVQFSQVDAAFPLSGVDGPAYGLPYVLKTLPWAKHAGCAEYRHHRRAASPGRESAMRKPWSLMKRQYEQIIEVAEAYEIKINIEVHGYFTTKPDFLARMLEFVDSPLLGLNFDTGNSFIAGQDPVAFCERFKDKINHVHIKDVSESLAAAVRGGQTGIALSHCSVGEGVNADNIKQCLTILRDQGFTGHLSIECEGQGGPLLEKSLTWLRATMQELDIPEEK
jgi:sugar phosphate isomerase/epimerase